MNNVDPFLKKDAQLQCLYQNVLQKQRGHNSEKYVAFVDLVKEYDSEKRELLELFGKQKEVILVLKEFKGKKEYILRLGKKRKIIPCIIRIKQSDARYIHHASSISNN